MTETASPAAPPRPSRIGRVLVTIAIVGMVSMWGYVVYLAFGPGRADSPDKLDDPAFATAAQTACDQALDRIGQLPSASESPDAAARAITLTKANTYLVDMLADLEAIRPPGEDGVLVGRWLADWNTYLRDRQDYATALRTDPKARLYVTEKGRRQITEYLDQFAKDNDMPACSTPGDAA